MVETIDPSKDYRLRPRFKVTTKHGPDEVVYLIGEALKKEKCPVLGKSIPGYVTLKMPAVQRKLWSPIFTMTVESIPGEKGSLLRGVYSPAAGIWTMLVFFYVILGFSLFIVLMWGLSLFSLGQEASILWLALIIFIGMVALWLFAQVGQKLSRHQMKTMHELVEETLDIKIR
nr:hypothetical protein [Saprospiraceae bacterium]